MSNSIWLTLAISASSAAIIAALHPHTATATGATSAQAYAMEAGATHARTTAPSERVFEIRTYTTYPGRLEALNTRFRDHTMRIFAKHGMTSIGYWIPQDSIRAKNTLIYMIAHESRAQADVNWKEFVADPEWQRVAEASQVDGKIIEKIESVYVSPTDYSPIK